MTNFTITQAGTITFQQEINLEDNQQVEALMEELEHGYSDTPEHYYSLAYEGYNEISGETCSHTLADHYKGPSLG